MYSFEPIIGSGFDQLGAQRQYWAGFNNRIEENNMARANDAQQQRNRYFAALAEMDRQDQARQDALDEARYRFDASREDSDRAFQAAQAQHAQDFGEKRREFDLSADIQREAEKEKNKYLAWHYDIADKSKKKDLDAIDKFATFLAPDLHEVGSKFDAAETDYQKAINDFEMARSNIEKDLPAGKIEYDTRGKAFKTKIKSSDPELAKQVIDANERLAEARSALDTSKLDYQTQYNAFENMKKQAASNNLLVGKRNGRYVIYSPLHDHTYGDVTPGAAAPFDPSQTSPDAPFGWQQTTGGDAYRPRLSAPPAMTAGAAAPPGAPPPPPPVAATTNAPAPWVGFTNSAPTLSATNAPVTVAPDTNAPVSANSPSGWRGKPPVEVVRQVLKDNQNDRDKTRMALKLMGYTL